jgi:hypothetical protein
MRMIIAAALFLGACREEIPYEGAFTFPVASAVLQPEVGGPMADHEPVGFVANGTGGRIVLLALKQGRFLTDDASASFLRTNDLPTGGSRLLTSVSPYAASRFDVVVFAGDAAFQHLIEVPWVVGSEPAGGVEAPVEGYASYFPPDVSGSDVQLTELEVKTGYTTSERWTLTSDGSAWTVEGSRSGRQPTQAEPGVTFVAEERRISFVVSGPGTSGDVVTVDTWNGLVEHDVGGTPQQLAMAPDQSALAMIVHDVGLDRPVVRWFDPASRRVTVDVSLPADARPHRLEWSADGQTMFVTDVGRAAVWTVSPGSTGAVEHVMPWPTLDVASLDGDRRQLFVVPSDGASLWRYDLDDASFIDLDAWTEGAQGLTFDSPVSGVTANRQEHLFPQYTDDLVRLSGRTVAVGLAQGSVVFADEATGCLVQDNLGPRTVLAQSGATADVTTNYTEVAVTGPYLEPSGSSTRSVSVNPCAGVAGDDSWTLRYDENEQAWVVESEVRGEQVARAREDERYISDGGEVSFTIRAGSSPSKDGMVMQFQVDAGVATADGDNDRDGARDVDFAVPSDPVSFHYEVGDRDGDWYVVDDRPLVLILGSSSNSALRIDPQDADVDVSWQ